MSEQVREFWDSQAIEYGSDIIATMPDRFIKDIEIKVLEKYLLDDSTVADIGCGNGYATFNFAEKFNLNITGIDFSPKMIEIAKRENLNKINIMSKIEFKEGDIRKLSFDDNYFDVVITDRCVQNLLSLEEQDNAIREVARILKPNGLYLMCESTKQGLNNLNAVRESVGLEKIETRWHNLFLDEYHIKESMNDIFELVKEERFSSFYYLASRVINGKIAQMDSCPPDADSKINLVASLCSSSFDFGDYGPLKLFVLKKRVIAIK